MSSIYAFSKKVKDIKVVHKEIADSADIAKIEEVIGRLEGLSKASKSGLDELDLRINPKNWATSLLRGYPDNLKREDGEYLLIDFTDAMKTRMREEYKYAIALLMENKLFLCHSLFGEETITPEWKIIPRMLDTDNVLRYVCFMDENGITTVKYWEREATSSFIEWLGLPYKKAFLFGGKYRVYCEIEGITTEFQLDEDDMKKWMEDHPELREGRIRFSSPIEFLNISEIRVGRKRYENTQDFIQDYKAENYGIPRYQKEYERINRGVLPLLMKYYDEKTQVVRREGEQEITEVQKSTPSFDILFVNEHTELRASYLGDIVQRCINGEQINAFHAGLKFRESPFIFGSMRIYNEIQLDSLTRRIVNYYNDISLQDRTLDATLKYAIFKRLAEINGKLPVTHFFEPLSQEIIKSAILKGKWTKTEDKVLEYKSGDFIAGGNEEVIRKLSEDLRKKFKESSLKIYCIGVEDDGVVHPIPSSRLKSDRIESIRNELQDVLSVDNVYACPVIQGEEGILLIMALRK